MEPENRTIRIPCPFRIKCKLTNPFGLGYLEVARIPLPLWNVWMEVVLQLSLPVHPRPWRGNLALRVCHQSLWWRSGNIILNRGKYLSLSNVTTFQVYEGKWTLWIKALLFTGDNTTVLFLFKQNVSFESSLKKNLTYLFWSNFFVLYIWWTKQRGLSLQSFLCTLFPLWHPTHLSHINWGFLTFKCSSLSFQLIWYTFSLWAIQQSPNSQYYSI